MESIGIINFSNENKSRTGIILNSFIKGIVKVDGNIRIYNFTLPDWNLNPCKGCFSCWYTSPGECVINDDFKKNIPLIKKLDMLIFSGPIWAGYGNHLFKNFTGRLVSIANPLIFKRDNRFGHLRRPDTLFSKFLLISTCSLPGLNNFMSILEFFRTSQPLIDVSFAGGLLRSQSREFDFMTKNENDSFNQLCEETGSFFITNLLLKDDHIERVSKPKMTADEYVMMINSHFKKPKIDSHE